MWAVLNRKLLIMDCVIRDWAQPAERKMAFFHKFEGSYVELAKMNEKYSQSGYFSVLLVLCASLWCSYEHLYL